ncbi:hypothetical protein [[Limnothrix rosea] IAM M-220]|uniref:hypothetical protein n=1 Tax=[Limnothrix rosea] IAM M-220 TaxID=454133 RepID=UPI0009675FEE|nr:hypothetical protein [[Limnothrix rosea] IAM M-220]OKH19739.1 hypothetical protein NIES208_01010 [[Limnothrix rosea] IAM M-220]
MKNTLSKLSLGFLLSATTFSASFFLTPAAIAQQITSATPSGTDVPNDSSITWKFDNTNLIKSDSIQILLDDVDVTDESFIDVGGNTFGFKPDTPLEPGMHKVEVQFTSTSGVGYRAAWSFEVVDVDLGIEVMYHNAVDVALTTGDTFRAELRGTPDADADILLLQNGQTLKTLDATEEQPGIYRVSMSVGSGDRVSEGIVIGRLEKAGQVVFSLVDAPFALNPAATGDTAVVTQEVTTSTGTETALTETTETVEPLSLEITSHEDGDMIRSDNGFTLVGQTNPDADVRVTVVSEAPSVLGGFLSIGSATTLLNRSRAQVDETGTFEIAIPRPAIINSGQQYSITVISELGDQKEEVEFVVEQR